MTTGAAACVVVMLVWCKALRHRILAAHLREDTSAEMERQRNLPRASFWLQAQVAIAVGDDKLRPAVPRGAHPGFAGIARAALDPEPPMRPDFASLVEQLAPLAAELLAGEAVGAAPASAGVFGRLFKPQ